MVVTDLPSTIDIGVTQARVACPSICTVQAPQDAMPQPNLVPVNLSSSRSTHNSGVLASTPTSLRTPLTVKATMRFLHLTVTEIFGLTKTPAPHLCAIAPHGPCLRANSNGFASERRGAVWPLPPRSLHFEARELDHLGPLLGFLGDELAEVGGR